MTDSTVVVVLARCRYGDDRADAAAAASSCDIGWCCRGCCCCGGGGDGGDGCVCSCGVADFQRAPSKRNDARTERLRCRPTDADAAALAVDVGPDDDADADADAEGGAHGEFNSADKGR